MDSYNDPRMDLSRHVVQLARTLDRLTPGTYMITVVKPDIRQQDWKIEIVRSERIVSGVISSTQQESI